MYDTARDVALAAERLRSTVESHPLFRRYLHWARRLRATNSPQWHTEPWQAVGARLFAAGNFGLLAEGRAKASMSVPAGWVGETPDYLEAQRFAVRTAQKLLEARTYAWAHEMVRVADAKPLPPHTIGSRVMPQRLMFWSFEQAFLHSPETGEQADWVLLEDRDEGIGIVYLFSEDRRGTVKIPGQFIPYKTRWPENFALEARSDVGRVLKMLGFLASPYIDEQPVRLRRAERRELLRAGVAEPDPEIQIVTFRRRPPDDAGGAADGRTGRSYSHQWWVEGHFRNQWFPSEQDHKIIWIESHLKGPPDKPLLEKVNSVVR